MTCLATVSCTFRPERSRGDDLARHMYYASEATNVREWLKYCQHTIPRYHNYPY